jgi:hypothetical protein
VPWILTLVSYHCLYLCMMMYMLYHECFRLDVYSPVSRDLDLFYVKYPALFAFEWKATIKRLFFFLFSLVRSFTSLHVSDTKCQDERSILVGTG